MPSGRRVNKFLAAGAAIVTAGALAASPITPSSSTTLSLPALQQRAVELTALSATASPLVVYPEILTTTLTNLSALGQAIAADPLPILSQIARNQIGYAEEIGGAIAGVPAAWQTYSAGRGATFLTNYRDALAAGNTASAVNYLSSYVLYGLQATLTPIYNTFLTHTVRGSTTPIEGIPQQMAQNFANAVGALFSTTTFVSGIFQSSYGMALGTLVAAGEGIAAVAQSVEAGDAVGAINAAVNLPGLVVNAFLNGWQHPQSAAPFPALLTFIPVAPPTDPANGVTKTGVSIGLLGRLLVTIPQAIAKAIKPATTTASSTAAITASVTTESTASTASAAATESTGTTASTEQAGDTSTSSSASTGGTTTTATEKDSTTASSVTAAASSKAAKKSSTSSAKASDDSGSAGTKKSAGSGHSARAKASASSDSK
ncbi:hypothetical protein CG716_06645 [Mycolicibacterium sphagni]|uniref:PE-PGRS family protein n=1 Tax=Mycolicibacterium sphagni TaxID=1786 RepID=A0A255DPN6_9MYCO|nr:hypothetical protein CG716_06645 [Mycolicibacterium sphagni]